MKARTPKILLAITAALFVTVAKAQDTNYVASYGHRMSAKAFFFSDNFEMSSSDAGLNYIPQSHSGVGIGIWTKYFPFDISYRHEVAFSGGFKYRKTGATDMQLKGYSRFFVGDIYIQHYTGFLETEEDEIYKVSEMTDSEKYQPDLSAFYFAAIGNYVFNHEQFSYNAGFNGSERQKISAGTPLAGLAIYNQRISSDSTMFLGEKADLKSWSLGINGGYAYNFVIKSKFLIFLAGNVGINASGCNFGKIFSKEAKIAPAIHAKFAFWYNMKHWSIGLTGTGNNLKESFGSNIGITQNSSKTELIFVRRFCYKQSHNS